MKYLFNTKGQHIANFVNGRLYAPTGQNIGHFLEREAIFIDMDGSYLGEIVLENRLLQSTSSANKSANYGSRGNFGDAGNYGNPGNYGSIGIIGGFDEVSADWLK